MTFLLASNSSMILSTCCLMFLIFALGLVWSPISVNSFLMPFAVFILSSSLMMLTISMSLDTSSSMYTPGNLFLRMLSIFFCVSLMPAMSSFSLFLPYNVLAISMPSRRQPAGTNLIIAPPEAQP